MKSPDQEVSEQILDLFREQKILQNDSLKGLANKMAAGKMKANDWKVLFKLDAAKGKPHAEREDET